MFACLFMIGPHLGKSLHPLMNMCRPTINCSRHPIPTSLLHRLGAYYRPWQGSSHPLPWFHNIMRLIIHFYMVPYILINPRDLVDLSIPDWIQGDTLSPIINGLVMAWPLRLVLDACCPTIDCSKYPLPTSLLHRLGTYYKLWHGSSHPLPRLKHSCVLSSISTCCHAQWSCQEIMLICLFSNRYKKTHYHP